MISFSPALLLGKFDVVEATVGTLITPVQVLGADPERVALIVSNVGANTAYLSTTRQSATANGIVLLTNGLPLILKYADLGELVGREWWCINAVGAGSLRVITVAFRPGRGE